MQYVLHEQGVSRPSPFYLSPGTKLTAARSYNNQTYAYYFTVPPALHGQDVPYTYFNGPSESVVNDTIAIAMQEYITHWAATGTPNQPGVPFFPIYGKNASVQDLGTTGIFQFVDPTANQRCDWWQKALYQ